METLEAIRTRRSIRKYEDRPVPEEMIRRVLGAAMMAPTARDERPWHFIVIDDRELLAEIPTVCGSLREALETLEKDHEFLLHGDVFTKDQIAGYIALKWPEVYMMEHTPHPVEYQMYYSL